MKKYLLLLLCSVILFSCNQDEVHPRSYMFLFFPRDCNYAWVDFAQLVAEPEFGPNMYNTVSLKDKSIKTENFIFTITTCDIMDSFMLAKRNDPQYDPVNYPLYLMIDYKYINNIDSMNKNHDLQIEKQLADSYTRAHQSASLGGMDTPPPVDMDYRLTEVRNLIISSNVTLFGQAAGSSLNSYIQINYIAPYCVVSAQKHLVLGFNESIYKKSISEWLSMHPLAAPYMAFQFKTTPQEAPIDAKIILTMEMAGGAILRDTSRVITLLP